jgi:hypothetical protein
MDKISEAKLKKYFNVTGKAIRKAKESKNRIADMDHQRKDFLDMITRYYSDAEHFYKKKDFVDAFAALNYAHGWLDAGARLGLFLLH